MKLLLTCCCWFTGADVQNLVGNTLSSDGTTKHHRLYEGFQATLPGGRSISLGLKETGSGDSATLLQV